MRKTFVRILWGVLCASVIFLAIAFTSIWFGWIGYMPDIADLQNPISRYASQVYSVDGKILGTYNMNRENRVHVDFDGLSPYLVQALVATEDERFYEHSGIDFIALTRAVVKRGILGQKSAGGGSTITQQLAKQLYSATAKSTLERVMQKPIEWVIAVKLERFYTKEEIITMYLNYFDFLHNAVGIKTASDVYFRKDPKNLTVTEAATLIGLCKNPSYYNPVRYPERCLERRNVVLGQMLKTGYLTDGQYHEALEKQLTLNFHRIDHKDGIATYFREFLRRYMMAEKPKTSDYPSWNRVQYSIDSTAWETDPLYGWCNKNFKKNGEPYNVYTDGLKIFTTIDSRMQKYAEEAVYEHVAKYLQPRFFKEKRGRKTAPYTNQLTPEEVEQILNRSIRQSDRYRTMKADGCSEAEIMKAFNTKYEMSVFSWDGEKDTIMTPLDSIKYYKHFLRAGFMSMDPITGHVKAYVGGPNYNYFQYDMAMVGRRQVGSTIKPYLYALAMENGFSPCDEVRNVEQTLFDENGKAWSPRNSSKSHYGEIVTLKWGLANSNNWISAYLMSKLSPYDLVRLIHSFGVLNKDVQPTVSLCLGPCEISVGEMVSAYTAFVNKGIRTAPLFVTRIEDNDGNVVATFTPQVNEVISESTAYKMLVMLRAVINEGTGGRVRRLYGIKADMGGKTGTTNRNSDGWFMGFTPSLVSGCWVGGEERDIHFDTMRDGQGASMALPIWGIYMQKVYADKTLGYSQDETFDIPGDFDPCKDRLTEIEEENTTRLDDVFFQ